MTRAVLLCCSCTLAAPSEKEVFTRPTPGVPCTTTVYRKGGNTSEGTLDVECTRGWGIIGETLGNAAIAGIFRAGILAAPTLATAKAASSRVRPV